jgi:DNA-binding transcriptional LysR family regulator
MVDACIPKSFVPFWRSNQRSFGAAAEKLHLAQTTVSARVRLLEERLGRVLFIRSKTGAELTPAGEQLLRYAPPTRTAGI